MGRPGRVQPRQQHLDAQAARGGARARVLAPRHRRGGTAHGGARLRARRAGPCTLIARQEIEYLRPVPYQRNPLDVQLWFGKHRRIEHRGLLRGLQPRLGGGPGAVRARVRGRRDGGCRHRADPCGSPTSSAPPGSRTSAIRSSTRTGAEQDQGASAGGRRNPHHDLLRDAGEQHPVARVDPPGREAAPAARARRLLDVQHPVVDPTGAVPPHRVIEARDLETRSRPRDAVGAQDRLLDRQVAQVGERRAVDARGRRGSRAAFASTPPAAARARPRPSGRSARGRAADPAGGR